MQVPIIRATIIYLSVPSVYTYCPRPEGCRGVSLGFPVTLHSLYKVTPPVGVEIGIVGRFIDKSKFALMVMIPALPTDDDPA